MKALGLVVLSICNFVGFWWGIKYLMLILPPFLSTIFAFAIVLCLNIIVEEKVEKINQKILDTVEIE